MLETEVLGKLNQGGLGIQGQLGFLRKTQSKDKKKLKNGLMDLRRRDLQKRIYCKCYSDG